jgi:ABC-2 type transport system permease protein
MSKFKLIAKQVIHKNLRSFSWWSLVLMPFLMAALIGGIGWYNHRFSNKQAEVALVATPNIAKSIVLQGNKTIKYEKYNSENKAKQALKQKRIDGYLIIDNQVEHPRLVVNSKGDQIDESIVQNAISATKTSMVSQELNLNQAQLSKLFTTPKIKVSDIHNRKVPKNKFETKKILSFVVGFAMYLFFISYGSVVAQEIGTEKGSRIEESILTAVKAETQFFGKLAGIAVLVAIQLVLYAVGGIIAWHFRKQLPIPSSFINSIHLDKSIELFMGYLLLFLIIGIITYTILAALCGSLVSNQEQLSQAIMPLIILVMIGFFGALQVEHGNNIVLTVLSYIPFTGAIIMPTRLAENQVGDLQVIIALLINAVFCFGFAVFAAKVYKANVLVYDDKGILSSIKKSLKFIKK